MQYVTIGSMIAVAGNVFIVTGRTGITILLPENTLVA